MTLIIILSLIAAVVFGGSTVKAGVIAGFLVFLGAAVIYASLPRPLKSVIVFFKLPVDFALSFIVFGMVGGNTATSLLAAVSCGVLVTAALAQQAHQFKGESTLVNDVESIVINSRHL